MSISDGSPEPNGQQQNGHAPHQFGNNADMNGKGANGGSAGAGGGPRTMADITRLFMNSASPADAKRPQRISPRARAAMPDQVPVFRRASIIPQEIAPPEPTVERNTPDTETWLDDDAHANPNLFHAGSLQPPPTLPIPAPPPSPPSAAETPSSTPLPQIQIILPTAPDTHESFLAAAQRLAHHRRCTLGIIAYDAGAITLWRLGGNPERPSHFHLNGTLSPSIPADVKIARALFALRSHVDAWLIAPPPSALDPTFAAKCRDACPHWLLTTGLDNAALVDAYRTLKSACTPAETHRHVRLLVLDGQPAEAANAHARLNHVARGFLDFELELLAAPPHPYPDPTPLARIVPGKDEPATAAMWLSILDFIHEIQAPAHECDAEDQEAEEEPEEPEEKSPAPSRPIAASNGHHANGIATPKPLQPPPIATPVPTPAPIPKIAYPSPAPTSPAATLRAVDAPAKPPTAPQLWELVKQSTAGLRACSSPLDAAPPQQSTALLAADAHGTLHLWVLANPADPAAWSAAWQWTQAHRSLIALTRRDGPINPHASVHAHIILPPNTRPPALFAPGDAPIHWYRCEDISWGERQGLIVVPCHAT